MKISKEEIQLFLRTDLAAFVQRAFHELNPETAYLHNWHIEVIVEALEQCRLGKLRRLIINVPPRSLKSHMVSVSFIAWLLGHNPSTQAICVSYAQDLADKLAGDCRSVVTSPWYQGLFPTTRLTTPRPAVNDFMTTQRGFRLATSVGGVLTGRGADFIIIDDPLKPDEALSMTQRNATNQWCDHTLISRLNNKRDGCIILIMQRLHEDDLVGHVLQQGDWRVLKFPAIAQENEIHIIQTPYGRKVFRRREGEALHPEREPLEVLARMREVQGEYHFAGQYQQAPAPLGGGLVKQDWFNTYNANDPPAKFEAIFQSWDTANKPTELSDFSVCTTWGAKDKHLYLIHVFRKRLGYPELKRAVREQAEAFSATTILIEDKASGTQLIQELINEGMHAIKRYEPTMEKTMRMHSVTSTIENGFVHLPDKAAWLNEYVQELVTFPNAKFDDQADSTSQFLDWFKNNSSHGAYGVHEYYKRELERSMAAQRSATITVEARKKWMREGKAPPCPRPECGSTSTILIGGRTGPVVHCNDCGANDGVLTVPKEDSSAHVHRWRVIPCGMEQCDDCEEQRPIGNGPRPPTNGMSQAQLAARTGVGRLGR